MRDCTRPALKDRLPELLTEPGADADVVRAHVAECEACARELELLRQVRALAIAPALDVARIAAALPSYQASPWRRMWRAPALRAAAVILLVAGGATVLARSGGVEVRDTTVARVASSESAAAVAPVTRAPAAAPELAVGDPLTDLSESDLRALLDEMTAIQAVTSTETDIVVLPAVGQGGA